MRLQAWGIERELAIRKKSKPNESPNLIFEAGEVERSIGTIRNLTRMGDTSFCYAAYACCKRSQRNRPPLDLRTIRLIVLNVCASGLSSADNDSCTLLTQNASLLRFGAVSSPLLPVQEAEHTT